jgi:hypothetical protein
LIDVNTPNNNLYSAVTAPVPSKAASTWNASTGLTGTQPAGCDGSAALWHDLGALGGTAVDTNSGSKSAGMQRVVLATYQPSMTNSQPANVTQVNGTTLLAGTGAQGSGSPRVIPAPPFAWASSMIVEASKR